MPDSINEFISMTISTPWQHLVVNKKRSKEHNNGCQNANKLANNSCNLAH